MCAAKICWLALVAHHGWSLWRETDNTGVWELPGEQEGEGTMELRRHAGQSETEPACRGAELGSLRAPISAPSSYESLGPGNIGKGRRDHGVSNAQISSVTFEETRPPLPLCYSSASAFLGLRARWAGRGHRYCRTGLYEVMQCCWRKEV